MKTLGAMIDCSRNGVYTVDALKKYIKLLSAMGYDYLQLYTEDTFEVDGEPYFGYLRGRYSKDELKELDSYAAECGMELVPCIQTLAHLAGILRWQPYGSIRDIDNILLAGDARVYGLLDNVFKACAECFKSRRINIGMDEAHAVGLGRYLDIHGYRDRFDILCEHLKKVCEIARKYGFKPIMWSDMFFRLANHGEYGAGESFTLPDDVINAVPPDIELAYWDYYSDDKAHYDAMFKAHGQFKNRTVFACGAWCWSGFAPHNRWSTSINKKAFLSCAENGIDEIFVTCWKDDGAESSLFCNLPSLYAASEFFKGNYDEKSIAAGFERLTGIPYNGFLSLDLPDVIAPSYPKNPSKYMLYSDPFLGFLDANAEIGRGEQFAKAKKKLKKYAANPDYGYIFDTLCALCGVLEIKFDLGLRTREIYIRRDKSELKKLISDYKLLERRVQRLYSAFREQRDRECKLNGFEVHDVRLGGLLVRIKHCRELLSELYADKITAIPALDEKILKPSAPCDIEFNDWLKTAMIKPLESR